MIDAPRADDDAKLSRMKRTLADTSRRLTQRAPVILAVVLLILIFVFFGGLAPRAAAWGAVAFLLWSAAWPVAEDKSAIEDRALRRTGDDANGPAWLLVIANLPDPAIVLDRDEIVLTFNRALSDLFPGAQAGRHVSQVTRAPELLTATGVARETRQTQLCRLDFRVPVERSLVATVAPLGARLNLEHNPDVLVVMRDLTEQDRIVRMRADFVANASHELRTPLASLKGFVETLRGAAKDDAQAREKFLKIMQQQAERMARIIDDLLSLSRIEMRAHVIPREAVNLDGVISYVVQTLTPIAAEKSVAIDFAATASPLVVTGDRDELIQVFQNLIENGIKYGRNGGSVVIRQSTDLAGRAAVSVTDDGCGIAAQHLPRLTERFYRVNAEQSRSTGGTGLGLAIVKHVLNRHQADLQIESVVGKGSTFRVTFPKQQNK
jgi:two-component system, OmpR family, phosphate regulon sensor histidine kinase PhoR